jgi:hypothetical protein
MTTDFRALCAELTDAFEDWLRTNSSGGISLDDGTDAELIYRARAALAQPEPQRKDCPGCEGTPVASNSPCAVCGRAQPEPAPTDEGLYELWEESGFESDRFARAVLARWGSHS